MRVNSLIILVVLLVVLSTAGPVQADHGDGDTHDVHHREYEVKAAFIYNFMNFIDRPQDKRTKKQDSGKPVIIGTVGVCLDGHDMNEIFGPLAKKKFKNRSIVVKHFPGFEQYRRKTRGKAKYKNKYKAEYSAAMKDCHVLFVASSEAKYVKEIMVFVKGGNVLTVGETEGFCRSGGIIKFVTEGKKIRFEINLAAAKRAKLEIRSKLLRLARKIIKKDDNASGKAKR